MEAAAAFCSSRNLFHTKKTENLLLAFRDERTSRGEQESMKPVGANLSEQSTWMTGKFQILSSTHEGGEQLQTRASTPKPIIFQKAQSLTSHINSVSHSNSHSNMTPATPAGLTSNKPT